MIFDHVVKYEGVYYASGQSVPIGEIVGESSTDSPSFVTEKHVYTEAELSDMSVKEIKKIAEELGFQIKKISPKDAVVKEFLDKQ